jgi:hypothetical protein
MHSGFGVLYFLCDLVVLRQCVGGGGIWSREWWTVSILNIVFGLQDCSCITRRKSGLEFSFFLVSDQCGVSFGGVSVFL